MFLLWRLKYIKMMMKENPWMLMCFNVLIFRIPGRLLIKACDLFYILVKHAHENDFNVSIRIYKKSLVPSWVQNIYVWWKSKKRTRPSFVKSGNHRQESIWRIIITNISASLTESRCIDAEWNWGSNYTFFVQNRVDENNALLKCSITY